jgi:hypothetical protein
MDSFRFSGTEDSLKLKMSEFMSDIDIQHFIRNIEKIVEFLDDDEYVEKRFSFPQSQPGFLQFLIPNTNYNINIKALSLTTLALLFDIHITSGFMSALLGITGFNSHSIVLLNEIEGEKCMVMEALRNKRIINKKIFSNSNSECVNNHLNCRHNKEGICHVKTENIEGILDILCDKNVFTKIGNVYKYNY